jgi:hypothetical protein
MGLLLCSPFHRFLGKNLTLFTYTGRKSGRRYSFPLGYFRAGQTIAIFAGNPWWKNFREPGPVTLTIRWAAACWHSPVGDATGRGERLAVGLSSCVTKLRQILRCYPGC